MGKISTGVPLIDKVLDGGVPTKSVVLLEGPPGAGKSTFLMEFVNEGLQNNQKCIVILTNDDPQRFKEKMKAFGWDPTGHEENMVFIDCYSYKRGGSKAKYAMTSITQLYELNALFDKAVKENNFTQGRIVLDSLSDIMLYSDSMTSMKFADNFTGKLRSMNASAILALEQGLHEEKDVLRMDHVTDGVIEMDFGEENRRMRVKKMHDQKHSLKWATFTIDKGIEVSVNEFFEA